jgi:hypothetical protein
MAQGEDAEGNQKTNGRCANMDSPTHHESHRGRENSIDAGLPVFRVYDMLLAVHDRLLPRSCVSCKPKPSARTPTP